MRILVIEDERRIALSLKKGLELEHYVVDISYNGVEGFDLASTEEYDLIILDRMLPHMDGMAVCRELRKKDIPTPILMLTAKGQTKDKIEGLDAGADDYVAKPFSFEELLARIRALFRRPKETAATILSVGDLRLDTKNFVVTRKQIPISLSSKEYALLEYFMRHQGQILSKEQIISHVWDYDADILPNTIEVYIKNLRSKIDDPFVGNAPLIHTVRGFGYKLATI
ncbi:MAG: response regulator transcription factor [Candidatus Roizmanbacteria bacterium]|nr:response regulator transcription factor [Candidatus Roizmanbacteria bacterium]